MVERQLSPEKYPALKAEERLEYEEGRLLMAGDSRDHTLLSARALVSQHGVPKSGLGKGFSGAPTAAFAAVGYLTRLLQLFPLAEAQGCRLPHQDCPQGALDLREIFP